MNKIFLSVLLFSSMLGADDSRIINGTIVEQADYPSIVNIRTLSAGCTATVVGPKTVISAAHCFDYSGQKAWFKIGEKEYEATMFQSPIYYLQGHDLALGTINEEVEGIKFSTIGGEFVEGTEMILFGYGCIDSFGTFDGNLHRGVTQMHELWNKFDLVSKMEGGSMLCSGDSGGPAYVEVEGKDYLVSINYAVNYSMALNFNTLLTQTDSEEFLDSFVENHDVQICGVNLDC